ncbi:MAG: acylneuraminate cytidylyltransferase family protein [Elusimicrobia bacterium]|nr:acylneuraminate cytidylyltransferase family protein [Elusimicrobiota bacterium]
MRVIATICARGGSKGVPRKNLRMLCGKPLIVHSIEQALACRSIERTYVSTDDLEIAEVARRAGAKVPFLRPAELATETAGKIPVIRHLAAHVLANDPPFDLLVDLDPTSPLRALEDIQACIDAVHSGVDNVITAYPAEKSPYFNMVERDGDGWARLVKPLDPPAVRRQDAPEVFSMNASIYVWRRETLERGLFGGKTHLHVMPRERSVDIDSEFDFMIVEKLMEGRRQPGDRAHA